jgi:hypothetical protein
MKAKELRIGNWISTIYGMEFQVYPMAFKQMPTDEKHNLILDTWKPISLTEEWLLKLGFNKNDKNRWVKEKSHYAIFYFEYYATGENNSMWRIEYHDTDYGKNEYKDCHQWGERIKYVHQLQNLYFALTGKEL